MSKKLIVTLLVAILVVIGGFWGVKTYLETQAHNAYLASPDRVADLLVADLKSGNYQDAYNNLFSARLRANYSIDYWKKTDPLFPLLKDYKDAPKLVMKKAANDIDPTLPKPYGDEVKAQQYVYDYHVHDQTYRVTLVIITLEGHWWVNELAGAYQQ